jgi:hypothetical protein
MVAAWTRSVLRLLRVGEITGGTMAKNVHESGEQKKGDGGWSRQDAKNFRAALDGVSDGNGPASDSAKGEKPQTGALRDIGNALDGNER